MQDLRVAGLPDYLQRKVNEQMHSSNRSTDYKQSRDNDYVDTRSTTEYTPRRPTEHKSTSKSKPSYTKDDRKRGRSDVVSTRYEKNQKGTESATSVTSYHEITVSLSRSSTLMSRKPTTSIRMND
jgi:hypothetical protein